MVSVPLPAPPGTACVATTQNQLGSSCRRAGEFLSNNEHNVVQHYVNQAKYTVESWEFQFLFQILDFFVIGLKFFIFF